MKHLCEGGYTNVDYDGIITITDKCKKIADMVYDRNQTIAKILIALGVDEKTTYKDSCKIEHDLSREISKE